MKKIIPLVASIILILIAGIFASAGTMAWFSDTETVGVHDIQAGTLDLTVDDQNPCTIHITIKDIAPGWSQRFEYTLKNTGTLAGELSVEFSEITNNELGRNEPEALVDDSGGWLGNGELGDKIIVGKIKFGGSGPRLYGRRADGTEYKYSWKDDLNELGGRTLYAPIGSPLGILVPGESETVYLDLRLDADVGNIVQSDSVEFDIIFHLDQA